MARWPDNYVSLTKRTDSKMCPRCGKEFFRSAYPQPDSSWAQRQFCSISCSARRPRTEQWKQRIAAAKTGVARPDLAGKARSAETRAKISASNKGKPKTWEHRRKLGKQGSENPKWRGGVTPLNKAIRNKLSGWARAIKKRDNYTCQKCGATEQLHADHIEPVALRPDLMFELSNGITLCFPCHKKTATYGGRRIYSALRGKEKWP